MRKEDLKLLYSQYAGFRLELVLDYIKLLSNNEDEKFSSSLIIGPEFGYISKDDNPYGKFSQYYTGLSAGVQFKFKVQPRLAVFIEPHCSIIPYSVGATEVGDLWVRNNYYDAIVNLNLGVEYNLW